MPTQTYLFPEVLDGSAQQFARGYLVTAVTAALDDAYTSQAGPHSAFLQGLCGDSKAVRAWAHGVGNGAITAEGMCFAAWICMAPTMHTARMREFHCARCALPPALVMIFYLGIYRWLSLQSDKSRCCVK